MTVTVREEDGALSFGVVEVVEDGARSMAPRPRADAGLDGLRDRVEALGGRLAIRSAPGRGLHVLGSLPLSR